MSVVDQVVNLNVVYSGGPTPPTPDPDEGQGPIDPAPNPDVGYGPRG